MDIEELTGETLAGRFALEELIGQGGYGAVFRGTQLSVGRECAVKVLSPRLVSDENTVERFRVEAKTTSRLNHPNTVVLYDFGRDDERSILFLAMELLEGESLREAVEERGPVSIREAVRIAGEVAGSLQEAHDAGTVHRDVKPGNVMLVERGGDDRFVKVIDFGIAKAVREDLDFKKSLTRKGMMVGTPAYMSPEQVRGEAIDGRTDQYALAMTVYFLVAGSTPFDGGSSMEIASKHLTTAPSPLSSLRPELDLPEAFDEVLLRAVEKEPEDRFDSVEEFAERLGEAAGEQFDSAPRSDQASAPRSEESTDGSAEATADRGASREREDAEEGATLAVPPSEWGEPAGGDVESERAPGRATSAGGDRVAGVSGSETAASGGGGRSGSVRKILVMAALGSAALFVVVAAVLAVGALDSREGEEGDRAAAVGSDASGAAAATGAAPTGGAATKPRSDGDARGAASRTDGDVAVDARDRTGEGADAAPDGGEGEPRPIRQASADESLESNESSESNESNESNEAGGRPGDRGESGTSGTGSPRGGGSGDREAAIVFRLIPWGTLYVDGERVGQGSRVETEIAPGRHEVTMQQNGRPVAEQVIRVGPGEERQIELVAP